MQGRIQNRSLLKKAADTLDLEGVKRFPGILDLGDIKATFDLGRYAEGQAPLASSFVALSAITGNFPAGSTLSVGVNMVGQGDNFSSSVFNPAITGIITPPGFNVSPPTIDNEWRVLSINASVSYTAAGAAIDAAAGARLIASVILKPLEINPAGDVLMWPVLEHFAAVENVAPYGWSWNFPQGASVPSAAKTQALGSQGKWDGYIPPGYYASFQLTRTPGTGFFPNLTSMTWSAQLASRPFRGDWKA